MPNLAQISYNKASWQQDNTSLRSPAEILTPYKGTRDRKNTSNTPYMFTCYSPLVETLRLVYDKQEAYVGMAQND
jgi:hypothetical protein